VGEAGAPVPSLRPFFPAGGYLKTDMRTKLESRAPIEAMMGRLLLTGVDAETAGSVISEIAGSSRNLCPPGGLSDMENVVTCRNCCCGTVTASEKKVGWLD
jgi:hypothetical protein